MSQAFDYQKLEYNNINDLRRRADILKIPYQKDSTKSELIKLLRAKNPDIFPSPAKQDKITSSIKTLKRKYSLTPEKDQKDTKNINVAFFSPDLEFSSSETSREASPVKTTQQSKLSFVDSGYFKYPYLRSTRMTPITPFLAKPPTELFHHRVKRSNIISYLYYILIIFCLLMFSIFVITQQLEWFPYSFFIFIAVCVVRYYRDKK